MFWSDLFFALLCKHNLFFILLTLHTVDWPKCCTQTKEQRKEQYCSISRTVFGDLKLFQDSLVGQFKEWADWTVVPQPHFVPHPIRSLSRHRGMDVALDFWGWVFNLCFSCLLLIIRNIHVFQFHLLIIPLKAGLVSSWKRDICHIAKHCLYCLM